MKNFIQSQLRHLFTGFSGVVVALVTFLVSKGYLTTEQAVEFTPLLSELFKNAGAVFSSLAAVVVSRAIITFLGNTKWGKSIADKLGMVTLCGLVTAAGLGVFLPSCTAFNNIVSKVDVRTTPDGCVLVGSTTATGQRYYGGRCIDGRYVARWDQRQEDGTLVEIRYTRFPDGLDRIEYRDGVKWLTWDDKSGIQIGAIPVTGNDQLALPVRGGNHGPPIVSDEAGIVPAK